MTEAALTRYTNIFDIFMSSKKWIFAMQAQLFFSIAPTGQELS